LENLALRQQLVVLARRRPRPQFSNWFRQLDLGSSSNLMNLS
jgi:hypothetical protein